MARGKQVSATVSEELKIDIGKMALSERRSESEMVAILLENAVKERKRKRKNGKEGSSSNNA